MKGLNISKGAGKLVQRKVDVRTVCIALEVDADASEKLHQTRHLYGQACEMLVPLIVADKERRERLWQRFNLHKAGYRMVRNRLPNLGSQLACNVMRSVSGAYQSWISNHPKFAKDKEMELPSIRFRNPVIHLDKNTIRFFHHHTEAKIYTADGRVRVRLRPGRYQQSLLAGFLTEEIAEKAKENRIYKLGECNLVWRCGIKGKPSGWELHIAVEKKLT